MVARGEVWWADLGPKKGSAPAWRRPVLVVSADAFNRSRIRTVTVVAITSNLRLAAAPGNVALAIGTAGLDRDSVINVSQVVTLDKGDMSKKLGNLEGLKMEQVDAGLRLALGL
ncbi:MAG TPA: type II toxin-antitoxin system PemK/MazF family toxin [Isosphaeraceae bacterium]|nr:type II toxin-antitoxin system PemK/MazF family toxin [Isosphaeraceae bacterium]